MSDHDHPPTDLFDAMCRLDDLAEWLAETGYPEEAALVQGVSDTLKGYIVIVATPDPTGQP